MMIWLTVAALFATSAQDGPKENVLSVCRATARTAYPQYVGADFKQPLDTYVRNCAASHGLLLDGWRPRCPQNSADPELFAECYRWDWEKATPHS
jgi:hypothetical protein